MRLIDADELDFFFCDSVFECSEQVAFAETIDAVPVVRCKNCDKSEPSNVWEGWIFCKANKIHHKDDNFCSYGERKDGDDDESS